MNQETALKKLQDTELEILLVIRDFCREWGIMWLLDSGTVLGAVRHGGFIPWDDDIDIAMPRADYDRFLELAAKGLPTGYSLHTFENTPGYAGFFAKVYKDGTRFETDETREAGCPQGIFVDVFCWDRAAFDPKELSDQIDNARKWQRLSYLYHSGTITVPHKGLLGAAERLGCQIAHGFVGLGVRDRSKLLQGYERSVIRDEDRPSNLVMNLSWTSWPPFSPEILFPTSSVSFEGYEFPAPGQTKRYLELAYGDWQALPKSEDRHTHLPRLLDFGDGNVWQQEG